MTDTFPQILILDGGLGTTLEDVFHQNISTPLWSAKPIEDDPEVIIAAHLAFLRAGADVILTSTYQCAYNTFERSGYSREDAKRIMLKSVRLAVEAKRRYAAEQGQHRQDEPHGSRGVKVALSLGPYGATLTPAQEFDGFYPPPFGPDLSHTAYEKTNVFPGTDEGRAQEHAAMEALTEFHLERLRVFAEDPETWDAIDFVAFETVPLRREITAIRQAVARLPNIAESRRTSLELKPWWISTVHPDGHYPEMKTGGGHTSFTDVVKTALFADAETKETVRPWGLGINCTSLEFLPQLLQELQTVVVGEQEVWLVLYPNRGDVYDPETQTWHIHGKDGSSWAAGLCDVVLDCLRAGVWAGVIVGGCCKTGPNEIAGLRQKLGK